ncbi:hypothetical protein M119_4805 [Bacteroides fragilis str. 3783N1-6]|uniref:Transmembrane protein n=1 Tax=Bacteroides fragilis str. 3783N1-6 TaxID=1339310 RepID=A0AB73AS61_BACFG|nr:hypothetical protein M118_4298 [Bacteroides fragilis str. 3783N1-2]EXY48717.1 hypothetical protein M121_4541 [Bacteroides fragilis str. 3783N2-1]EXY53796.1 hypothetical protein M122_4210 [Bacteroides fragilis str. 3976T7]EYB12049.1 hypothetical protein M119_4805 [Bacteroides fragilis str. 3783N1-6]
MRQGFQQAPPFPIIPSIWQSTLKKGRACVSCIYAQIKRSALLPLFLIHLSLEYPLYYLKEKMEFIFSYMDSSYAQ